MNKMSENKRFNLLLATAFSVLLSIMLSACLPTKIYIVRHAEKAGLPANDPVLTNDGQQRAQALKEALKNASIDAIIVSDLQRTQLTAQPLADHLGLQPIVIALRPPANPDQYIQNVVNEINDNWRGRDVLVVSHNTLLQQIAENLGSPAIGTINETSGYDNFFVIIKPGKSETTKFVRVRYGEQSE